MNGRGVATPYFAIKYNEKMATLDRNQRQNQQPHARSGSNKVESQPEERIQSLDIHSYPRRFQHQREKSMRESHEPYRPEKQHTSFVARKGSSNFDVNKNAPRVPIELHDEQANAAEQRIKGRVIYRNNIPKNSYYLLSNMQQLTHQPSWKPKNYSQNQMEFNSKFQSGNLSSVVRAAKNEYYAFMREDTNTHGLRQWYYFQARCNRPMRILFRVYKFSKRCLLYREGMRPYIKAEDGNWRQNGEDVSYDYDEALQCFYLSFSYTFTAQGESIEVANMPPYTYSKLLRFLQLLKPHQNVKVENIGESLGGVQIPSIQITRPSQENGSEGVRKCIVILGRTHPSQTCSNFTIESIVGKLLTSQLLLSTFDFFIVPMVNPDGVIVGNHRTGLLGNDLNRRFCAGNFQKQLFPEVEAIKSLVKRLQSIYKVQFLFDFHGHSAKSNIFAYAEEEILASEKYLKSRIIPKLLSHNFAAFKYSYCVFDQAKEKKNTARVYFRSKSIINAITFQQSYGLIDKNLISIQDWNNFGIAFIDALEQYTSHFLAENIALAEFLSQQIAIDQKNRQERIRRQRKTSKSIEIQKKAVLEQPQDKNAVFKKKEIHTMEDVIQEDQLDSGDEQLQATEQEIDFIQRNMIFRRRQSKQRDLFEMNDMSIELQHSRSPQKQESILHEQKMPLVSRIMRMKEKHKASRDLIDILTSRNLSERQEVKDTLRNVRLKLPSIPRYAG